jgi:hypothetical protein
MFFYYSYIYLYLLFIDKKAYIYDEQKFAIRTIISKALINSKENRKTRIVQSKYCIPKAWH